ncbi:hypothetical protein KIY57_13015 [Heyndrickxia coagulans]|nr:hypothetical protein KIY57_13015 [Heyndrickxia coagulans]
MSSKKKQPGRPGNTKTSINWLSYPQFDLGDGNGYFFGGVVGLFMAAKIQQHFFIWSSYTSVFAISTDARNRGTFSYG